ncbi:GPN-loop GTPase 3, partial [Dictyocoela roeselum]
MGQMIFVMGPAGSGKTTLCRAIKSYGTSIGRNIIYVNMDPFQQTDLNEMADISVSDYIRTEDIMESIDIGPNSALLRSMSEIAANIDELHIDTDEYYILDFPGQLELFSHCLSLIEIVEYCKKFHQCVAFYLMDAGCFKDDGKFLCGSLMCLMCVLRIAVPYYLIRSKADQGCVCRAEEHDLRGGNRELKDLNKDNHDLESSNHDLNKDDHDLESGNYDLNKDNHDLES